jgi:hypothetical protein
MLIRRITKINGEKKTGPKAGFSYLRLELLGGRSGRSSVSSRSSSVSRSGFHRSSSISRSGFHRSGRRFSSGGFGSRRFSSRRFFFLTASGHGNSQQSSQENGIFHLISLYVQI